jgi:hypothetical protein
MAAQQAMQVRWPLGTRAAWHLHANLGDAPTARTPPARSRIVYDSAPDDAAVAPPWSVQAWLERA